MSLLTANSTTVSLETTSNFHNRKMIDREFELQLTLPISPSHVQHIFVTNWS